MRSAVRKGDDNEEEVVEKEVEKEEEEEEGGEVEKATRGDIDIDEE